jgi:NADPH:quinone reductase-like Zn-dependent oxidoreductase
VKAAVVRNYGGPEMMSYEDVPDPVPGPGEVLVRVARASINPVDAFERGGALKAWRPLEFPAVIGWDVAGTVEGRGPGVTSLAVGDRVCAWAYHTYAELCVAKAELFAKIPDAMDLADAGAVPLVATTGNQLITQAAGDVAGCTVLVSGAAGGVGRAAVATAKMLGANVIAGVTMHQLDQADNIGADEIVALNDEKAFAAIPQVDVIANTVRGDTAAQLLSKVKKWGRYASATSLPGNVNDISNLHLISFVSSQDSKVIATMLDVMQNGKLHIPISGRFSFREAAKAMAAMDQHAAGKILLIP